MSFPDVIAAVLVGNLLTVSVIWGMRRLLFVPASDRNAHWGPTLAVAIPLAWAGLFVLISA